MLPLDKVGRAGNYNNREKPPPPPFKGEDCNTGDSPFDRLYFTRIIAMLNQYSSYRKTRKGLAMASKYWIKLYHEILDDPKMGRLDDALFRRAVECFLAAGDLGEDGDLPTTADLAWRLRADESELESQLAALAAVDILQKEADGTWSVTNFHKRQKSVSTRERVRRFREKERKNPEKDEESRNENVTKRYTDIDIEADKEEKRREMEKASASGSSQGDDLSKTFIAETGIPLHTGGEKKWEEALRRMRSAGVHTEDMREALHACYQKGLTIASLGSAVNPAIIEMSQRKARAGLGGHPADDYRRFLKGPYGDVGMG